MEKDPLEVVEVEDDDEKEKEPGKGGDTASEPDVTPEGYKGKYFVSLIGRSQRRTLHRGGVRYKGKFPQPACATKFARSASPAG